MSNLDLFRSNPFAALSKYHFNPSCDLQETKNEYVMKFDLPGIPKDQIKIEVDGNRLTISGERKEEKTEGKKEDKKHLSEVFYGSFMRAFSLPEQIDSERVSAAYENGVLTINVAKNNAQKTKQINVK